jgi:hypothetical protein
MKLLEKLLKIDKILLKLDDIKADTIQIKPIKKLVKEIWGIKIPDRHATDMSGQTDRHATDIEKDLRDTAQQLEHVKVKLSSAVMQCTPKEKQVLEFLASSPEFCSYAEIAKEFDVSQSRARDFLWKFRAYGIPIKMIKVENQIRKFRIIRSPTEIPIKT